MKKYRIKTILLSFIFIFIGFVIIMLAHGFKSSSKYFIPINSEDRNNLESIQLTDIGEFGIVRKARPNVPEHLHTGIDIKRPDNNYIDEPIFPITNGIVISIRDDGPYAQIIIEHKLDGEEKFWSIYEHIAGIKVEIYDEVTPELPIARFMTKNELDNYGWQFDHFHLEILKTEPNKREPTKDNPTLFYTSYWNKCLNEADLNKYYYNPINFLKFKL